MRPFEKQTQKVKIKKRENQGINETKATANTPKSINVVAKKCKKKQSEPREQECAYKASSKRDKKRSLSYRRKEREERKALYGTLHLKNTYKCRKLRHCRDKERRKKKLKGA